MTKVVHCGGIAIGGGAPVSVQSMITAKTWDVAAAVSEIKELGNRGCDIVRLAVPDMEAAEAFSRIRKQVDLPLVADIHFDYRLAVAAIRSGADKIRINPGNIGDRQGVQAIVAEAKKRGIPIRVGVNAGSLENDILRNQGVTPQGLVESAIRNISLLESMEFEEIVVSLKASSASMTYDAYRLLARETAYPLHIGVTEAGTYEDAMMKSAVCLGGLLLAGIGDTMRVSVTGDSLREPDVAIKILEAAGRRTKLVDFISCPTCGRTKVDLAVIADQLKKRVMAEVEPRWRREGHPPVSIAVMGCEVNGPGEARGADMGVACGQDKGSIFLKGEIIKTVPSNMIIEEMMKLIETL